MKICGVCGEEIKFSDLEKHHTNYAIDDKMPVHSWCHSDVHKTDLHKNLKPSWGAHHKVSFSKNCEKVLKAIKEKGVLSLDEIQSILPKSCSQAFALRVVHRLMIKENVVEMQYQNYSLRRPHSELSN